MQRLTSIPTPAAAGGEGGPPGAAMVYVPYQTGSTTCERYKHRQSKGLGVTQVIIGILCIIFNGVCLGVSTYGNGLGVVGHGFWCGILFVITGIFGVVAGKKKTKCQIITFMVMCIISAAFTIALLVVGIIGALTTRDYDYGCPSYGYNYDYYPYYRKPCNSMSSYGTIVAMESLLAICGVVEAAVAIWGAAICCGSGVCCCSSPTLVLPSAGYFPQNGQMIFISQTQGGQYVYSQQPTFAYDQGMTPPPSYVQPGCVVPTTNMDPAGLGQAPPAYMANQGGQPTWMMAPSATNQGPSAVQMPSAFPVQNKEGVDVVPWAV